MARKRLVLSAAVVILSWRMMPSLAAAPSASGGDQLPAKTAQPLQVEVTIPSLRSDELPSLGATLVPWVHDGTRDSATDTARLLEALPGATVAAAGGVSGLPVLDGLADDQLHIQINGMDILSACANHMNPPLSTLSPAQVGRIVVYPTVVPVSVGGDAIGGSIEIHSPAPVFAGPGQKFLSTGRIGTFFQSNGSVRGANLSATAATPEFSLNYSGSVVQSGDYRAAKAFKAPANGIDGDVVGSSLYRAEYQSLDAAYHRDGQLVDVRLDYQNIPYQGFPNARMDMTKNQSIGINLHYLGKFRWGNWDVRLYNQHIQHSMNFLADKMRGAALGMPMDTDAVNNGLWSKLSLFLGLYDTLRLGAGYQHYRLNDWWPPASPMMGMMGPAIFWNIRDGRRDRYDLFSEWERHWNPQWTSLLGLRLDVVQMNSGDVQGYNAMMYGNPGNPASLPGRFNALDRRRVDANWDFTAMLSYTPSDQSKFSFGFSRKAQSPNLYERYAWSNNPMAMTMNGWFGDGNGYIGNPDLRPQIANTLSLSAAFHAPDPKVWQVQVTPYFTYIQNYIGAARCPVAQGGACTLANLNATSGFVYLQFTNQTARLWGMDLSGKVRLAQTRHAGDFHWESNAAYVRGDNLSLDVPLYHMMPAYLRTALVQEWGHWRNRIEAVLVASKTRVDTVRNEPRTAGYGLLNLRTTYTSDRWQASLALENILNQFYQEPLGGVYLGQRPMLPGVPLPGPGRSVNASLSYSF